MRPPLPHARAKTLTLFFARIGPARAKVALHAPLPAVLHAFTHVRTPTRATRKHRDADANKKEAGAGISGHLRPESSVIFGGIRILSLRAASVQFSPQCVHADPQTFRRFFLVKSALGERGLYHARFKAVELVSESIGTRRRLGRFGFD